MTFTVQNASPTLVQIIKNGAKLDGAQVKISRAKKLLVSVNIAKNLLKKF